MARYLFDLHFFFQLGSARTSLIITIGPSARHHAETTSTIMFGQRVSNLSDIMVKLSMDQKRLISYFYIASVIHMNLQDLSSFLY